MRRKPAKKKPGKPKKPSPKKPGRPRPKPPGKPPGPTITEKDRRFIEEYLVDANATQAAIRAGFSPKTASAIGYELLQKTLVSEEIARRKEVQSARLGISADRVLKEYAAIAFARMGTFEDYAGHAAKSIKDLPPEEQAVIQEISETRYGRKLKLHAKGNSLDGLAKHLRLFYDPADAMLALLQALPDEVRRATIERLQGVVPAADAGARGGEGETAEPDADQGGPDGVPA